MGEDMSLKGVWQKSAHNEFDQVGEVVQDFGDRMVFSLVTSEYIEDDGRPFEDGEEVEMLVRRVDRTPTSEEIANRRDASDF